MNMPKQAPARIPAKFHLLATARLPKGNVSRAFTAKTYRIFYEESLKGERNTHIEALSNKDRQVHDGLSLGESVNLIMSADGPSSPIDEVWATWGEIGWKRTDRLVAKKNVCKKEDNIPPFFCAESKSAGEKPFLWNTTKYEIMLQMYEGHWVNKNRGYPYTKQMSRSCQPPGMNSSKVWNPQASRYQLALIFPPRRTVWKVLSISKSKQKICSVGWLPMFQHRGAKFSDEQEPAVLGHEWSARWLNTKVKQKGPFCLHPWEVVHTWFTGL